MTQLAEIWAKGDAAVNGWLSVGDPFVAEIMGAAGFDSLTIDAQHGFLDYADAKPMLQALRASGSTLMARVPWRDAGQVMKFLDAGCMGIICPMINTAEEAADFAAMLRYPPRGTRSYGPTRVNVATGGTYGVQMNDHVLGFAMIETRQGYDNVSEIVSTDGIDGVYIGPADLTLGLSNGRLPAGLDREEPEMVDAIKHILKTAHDHGRKAGIHCGGPEYAARAVEWGFDLVTVASDAGILSRGAGQAVSQAKALLGRGDDGAGDLVGY